MWRIENYGQSESVPQQALRGGGNPGDRGYQRRRRNLATAGFLDPRHPESARGCFTIIAALHGIMSLGTEGRYPHSMQIG